MLRLNVKVCFFNPQPPPDHYPPPKSKIPHRLRKVEYYTGWAAAKKEGAKETLKKLTEPFIDARLNDWLHQVQGSAEEVEVETWLAQYLVWKNGGRFALANLRMRGWVGE